MMIGPIMGGVASRKYTGTGTNIIFEGNSLVYGWGSTAGNTVPQQLARLPPLNGAVTVHNRGSNGASIADLRADPGSVDNVYVAGKENIVFVWEATNSIYSGWKRTGVQAGEDMAAYCAERLAVHPDYKIILLTTIPRFQTDSHFGANVAAGNAELSAYDSYIKANYQAMGAKAVVDVRAAGVFVYTGPTMQAELVPLYSDLVHLNDTSNAFIAQYCAAALRRLRA